MLTFQILDAGDTYFRPLDGRSLTVGSDPGADITLNDPGVAGIHAEVTVVGALCRIRSDAGMKVNGEDRTDAELTLGDRVELAGAVLVLGQQVLRPATADDVLDPSAPRSRREVFAEKRSPQMKRLLAGVLLLGVAVIVLMTQWGRSELATRIPDQDHEAIQLARRQGRFEDAERLLADLELRWGGVDAGRLALIRSHRVKVRHTKEAFDAMHRRYMADVLNTTERDQIEQLKEVRKSGAPEEQEAAVILMAGLREFRLAAEKTARPAVATPETEVAASSRKVEGMADPELPRPDWLDERLGEIRDYLKQKNYLHAIELAKVTLPEVPVKFAGALLDVMADTRSACRAEMKSLIGQAYALRKAGKLADAVRLLQREAKRFPGEGSLSDLYRELDQLAAEAGLPGPEAPVVDMASRRPPRVVRTERKRPDAPGGGSGDPDTGSSDPAVVDAGAGDEPVAKPTGRLDKRLIARVLQDVDAAERSGDLDKALQLLKESIDSNHDYQPRLADHLRGVRRDLLMVQALATAIGGGQIKGVNIKTTSGERLRASKVTNRGLEVAGSGGRTVPWLEVSVESAEALATAAGVPPEARLGIAVLGYRQGRPDAAEAFLARMLAADTRLFGKASNVIASGRGEYVDKEGYALIKGRFVARRFAGVEKLAKDFERRIERLAGQPPAQRDQAMRELRASTEPRAADALVLALKTQMDDLADKLARSALPKGLEKLRALRSRLDQARKHAKDLIYDTEKYFYPFKPPAVSGDRFSEYMKVQKEVDTRVAAVRELWGDKTKIPVAAGVRKDIGQLMWIEDELGKMGEVSDHVLRRVDWVHAVPPVSNLTLRNFCETAEERNALVHYMEIELLNETAAEELNDAEVAIVEITNSYRRMFGHRPLAIDLRLHKAARSHAEEMATLGYFSHTSPTPGRKSAFDRMRKAGYDYGVSENIALNPSADGAHNRWCHSSGHHRNLLNASHTEVGMGNSGRYWVQNFGRGNSYRDR